MSQFTYQNIPAEMLRRKQFVLWKTVIDEVGKTVKRPMHYATGIICDALDPNNWCDGPTAIAAYQAGIGQGIGFTFTENDPYFFFDLDHARNPATGEWSPLAIEMCQRFAGCYAEVSQSQEGLHIIGAYALKPKHAKKFNGPDFALELYTEKRFCALTGWGQGNCGNVGPLQALIDQYFPFKELMQPGAWTVGPCAEWNGPTDDNDLIEKMIHSVSKAGAFTSKIAAADLWAGVFPEGGQSEADAALVSHLAFWTGRDMTRIDRLFRRSGLMREKWDRSAGQGLTYGQLTIMKYAGSCRDVYGSQLGAPVATQLVENPAVQSGNRLDGTHGYKSGMQLQTIGSQKEFFKGCVYVRTTNKVFVPDGDLLDQAQFRATYGGFSFVMEEGNAKTSKNAWEAFTESRGYNFPKVHDICFRPEEAPGSIVTVDGRQAINTYIPVQTERRAGDPSRFLSHIARLLPDPKDQEILISYMAALVQYPGIKFQWAPLLIGMEGNGKSLVTRCISYAVGAKYTHLPNAQDINNKFNIWLYGKLFVGIEEVYTVDRQDMIEALKPMITNDKLEYQAKGGNQFTGENRANFILCSNHKDAVRKSNTDRRYAVFYTGQQEDGDIQKYGMDGNYFPDLYDWLRAEGYAIVNNYLRTYQIKDELNPAKGSHRAPQTSTTEEAIIESMGPVEQLIAEAIEMGLPGFCGGFISSMATDRYLESKRRGMSPRKRGEIIKAMGYIYHPALKDGRVSANLPEGRTVLYVGKDSLLRHIKDPAEVVRRYTDAQLNAATTASSAFGSATA